MAELNVISKEICKKKNLDKNLSLYMSNMMTLYSRFSYIKLSMNYYTFCDVAAELDGEYSREIIGFLSKLNGIIDSNIVNNSNENLDEKIACVINMRDAVTQTMEIVTAYVDRFAIIEHILNRVEFKFSDDEFDADYYEQNFSNEILNYILSDRDSVVINGKISEVMRQLPMRLTRNKFFDLIKDSMQLYLGHEKTSLDDFIYMLKTVSGTYEPAGFSVRFPDLFELLKKLNGTDYKNISHEEYVNAQNSLEFATSFLSKMSDLYVQLMELINDTLTILFAKPYAFFDSSEISNSISIISSTMNTSFDEDGGYGELKDITDKFIFFEGKQEKIYEAISSNDYVIDEIEKSFADRINELGLADELNSLKKIAKMASGSNFVSLSDTIINDELTQKDIEESFLKYHDELSEVFKESSQIYNRAVMSAVLASLPVFFNNVDEIRAFIDTSLSQCSDIAEKKACVTLIRMIMDDFNS
ncbi:MAG: hypothetical protein ACI4GD_08075 [Lachnospiraceae bacterium]